MATSKLQASLNRLKGKLTPISRNVRYAMNAGAEVDANLDNLANQAAREITPDVQQAMGAAYDRSGIKEQTGQLRRAIGNCVVRFGARTRSLVVLMPANLPKMVNKSGKSEYDPYKKAASLLYGRVIVPKVTRQIFDYPTGKSRWGVASVIGADAKRSIKKAALTGSKLSKRAAAAIKQGAKGPLIERKGFDVGGAKVVAPIPFFRLADFEKKSLADLFTQHLSKLVNAGLAK